MGKPLAVLDPKNVVYVQYRLRFDRPLRLTLKNEGYGNLGWVAHMEHTSMLSSIEDSKEREIFFDIKKNVLQSGVLVANKTACGRLSHKRCVGMS